MAETTKNVPEFARSAARIIVPLGITYRENVKRAEHLVGTYRKLYGKGRGRKAVAHSDLIRAAVVFMHATLEDLLRGLCMTYWPVSGRETLNKVPLAGMKFQGRAEKFFLGELEPFRGFLVQDLIVHSIREHLERTSYSDTDQVCSVLQDCGFEISDDLREVLPVLQEMMRRRHQIVHKADRLDGRHRGKQMAESISVSTFYRWLTAMYEFLVSVTAQIIQREHERSLRAAPGSTVKDTGELQRLRQLEREAKHASESAKKEQDPENEQRG